MKGEIGKEGRREGGRWGRKIGKEGDREGGGEGKAKKMHTLYWYPSG
jgi:hypothetical protein